MDSFGNGKGFYYLFEIVEAFFVEYFLGSGGIKMAEDIKFTIERECVGIDGFPCSLCESAFRLTVPFIIKANGGDVCLECAKKYVPDMVDSVLTANRNFGGKTVFDELEEYESEKFAEKIASRCERQGNNIMAKMLCPICGSVHSDAEIPEWIYIKDNNEPVCSRCAEKYVPELLEKVRHDNYTNWEKEDIQLKIL